MSWACAALLSLLATSSRAAGPKIEVVKDDSGWRLKVDGKDTLIRGVNWDEVPIGENYAYNFWGESDQFIKDTLDAEMGLLKEMNGNAIRQYTGIPPRWVEYIYKTFGIFTVINHPFGRYGINVNGTFEPSTNYADPATRTAIRNEIKAMAETYKDTPGILVVMLGNENNYGLHWKSSEIEALPQGQRDDARAIHLYTLFSQAIDDIHAIDKEHPVAICNGDLQYVDIIAKYVRNMDIFASNVYRGRSARDFYQVVKEKLDKPTFFSEFGADAYDAKNGRPDDVTQAGYLRDQWREIYEQTAGKGGVGNAIGGLTFQWSDGWWKHLQESNLDVHDTNATWPNAAYPEDLAEGGNNMNEEWFGITAKGPRDARGHTQIVPRAAYWALRQAYRLDPYEPGVTADKIRAHFAENVDVASAGAQSKASLLDEAVAALTRVRLWDTRLQLEMSGSGGDAIGGPHNGSPLRVDHMESLYLGVAAEPVPGFTGHVSVNVLGNVPQNRIDEIFFEKRGLPQVVRQPAGTNLTFFDVERVKLYQADVTWDHEWFKLEAFYRKGHYHWGYEGDFFGLFREANYQPDVDRYNANAPAGLIWSGKGLLEPVKIAMGPELFWGANPSIIAKYYQTFGIFTVSAIHSQDLARSTSIGTSNVVPSPQSQRTALVLSTAFGPATLTGGLIVAGVERVGRKYISAQPTDGPSYLSSGYNIREDTVQPLDTLGGRLKLTTGFGPIKTYIEGAYKGRVADHGGDETLNLTGWSLKADGTGNQWNVLGGFIANMGWLQIGPNFLYQKPLEGPLPNITGAFDKASQRVLPSIVPRNWIDDPFVVLGNREQLAAEVMFVFDPTPATFFWQWDNDMREDAVFAGSLDFTYRHLPTTRDTLFGFTGAGVMFPFNAAPPVEDLWDVSSKFVINAIPGTRILNRVYAGKGQARGPDPRVIVRGGGTTQWNVGALSAMAGVKINDWGPYDYHRDYNLTFPVQTFLDVSYGVTTPRLFMPYPRVGIRGQYRVLDEHSPRYPYAIGSGQLGNEYEVGTYLLLSM
jgi:hypothetical protein